MIYLVRGLKGKNKQDYLNKLGVLTISEDQYFIQDGKYHFDKTKVDDARKYCLIMLDAVCRFNIDIAVDNIFIKKSWMKPYFDIANKHKVQIKVINKHDEEPVKYIPEGYLTWIKENWED